MLIMANTQPVIREQPKFYKAADVASMLGVSETTAYRIIRGLNEELKQQGKITVAGKISKRYFEEKVAL
jgi:transposase